MVLPWQPDPKRFCAAGLEGVALRIALVYARLQPLLDEDAAVIAFGGALLRSPAWLQIMADVLGCPVQPSPVDEASARGVVVLALAALGSEAAPLSFTAPPYLPMRRRMHAIRKQPHDKKRSTRGSRNGANRRPAGLDRPVCRRLVDLNGRAHGRVVPSRCDPCGGPAHDDAVGLPFMAAKSPISARKTLTLTRSSSVALQA